MVRIPTSTDHDLLIKLSTQMDAVRDDIQKLSDGASSRLTRLETTTASQVEVTDHEIRIRKLEKSTWSVIAIASAFAAVVGWLSNALGSGLHI